MQTTSSTWKALVESGAFRLDAVATIDGVAYPNISAPVIERTLTNGRISVGNCSSATLQMSVLPGVVIPRSAEVTITMSITDGTTTSETLPAGTFYIGNRNVDPVTGLVTLTCYDAMLKADAEYTPTGTWPRAMADVAAEIASIMGVELDPRTSINTGADYMVSEPESGTTMRNILSGIASIHGANWIITPANKLRMVPLVSAVGASTASENVVNVIGIVGSIAVGDAQTVTGIKVYTGDGVEMYGSDSGIVLPVNSAYANANSGQDLATWLLYLQYAPYSLGGAIYDPAAELGDYVNSRDDVHSVLYTEKATLGVLFRGDISSPEQMGGVDEYPYAGGGGLTESITEQIAGLQINTINVKRANIDWAAITTLTANIIRAVSAELSNITALTIDTNELSAAFAHLFSVVATQIQTGSLTADTLSAVIADVITIQARVGDFDLATVTNLVASALTLKSGYAGSMMITNLAVVSANMLNVTISKLVMLGEDGKYYEVAVGSDGIVHTAEYTPTQEEIDNGRTTDGRQIVSQQTIVAEDINGQSVTAVSGTFDSIISAALTAGQITAQDALLASATIPALYTTSINAIGSTIDISANETILLNTGDNSRGLRRVLRLDGDGVHVGDSATTNELLLDSESVNVRMGGQTFSRFAGNYAQFGDYQIRRTTDGGLVFKKVV